MKLNKNLISDLAWVFQFSSSTQYPEILPDRCSSTIVCSFLQFF